MLKYYSFTANNCFFGTLRNSYKTKPNKNFFLKISDSKITFINIQKKIYLNPVQHKIRTLF